MEILKITTNNSRDLYAKFNCTCPAKRWKDSNISHIMKTEITLSGYNDDYFFNTVNKEPREHTCTCGKVYLFQWKEDGVHLKLKSNE